jgi:hypothetical protein
MFNKVITHMLYISALCQFSCFVVYTVNACEIFPNNSVCEIFVIISGGGYGRPFRFESGTGLPRDRTDGMYS